MATRKKAAAPAAPTPDTVDASADQDTPTTTPDAAAPEIPLDRMVRIYRKMGAKLAEIESEYEAKIAEVKVQQDLVKDSIRNYMKEQGAKSINTPYGTAILSKRTRYSTTDWDSFKKFVIENNALDLFEKRIAQANMATFLEKHPEKVPAGLNSDASYEVTVRKPKD